ncbi:uncharacterized protein METZ01_LOCUS271259 [marine metagenome]|uniref:Uncharacterized protein n=1 Tax=marine metagenome TaxID=408172 RepID=A0A382K3L3_9ZZZZ
MLGYLKFAVVFLPWEIIVIPILAYLF